MSRDTSHLSRSSSTTVENRDSAKLRDCTKLEALDREIQLSDEYRVNFVLQSLRESSALKIRRNALLPVSRIPEEILIRIFSLISNKQRSYVLSEVWWDWLTLTKVCKRWRDVALRCSVLWVQLRNFSLADKIQAFLERSKSADLFVDFTLRKENTYAIMSVLSEHMWRIRECEFTLVDTDQSWGFLRDHLKNLSSRNKTFTISAARTPKKSTRPFLDLSLDVVPIIRDKISLTGISASWSSTMFHGLLELSLCDIYSSSKPYMSEILDILECCPNLEVLSLYNAGPRFSDDLGDRTYTLSKAKEISLRRVDYQVDGFEQFFDYVKFPKEIRSFFSLLDYTFENLERFVPRLYEGRKKCERIDLELRDYMISAQGSSEHSSYENLISTGLGFSQGGLEDELPIDLGMIRIILEQPYFQNAKDTCINFLGDSEEICGLMATDESIWMQIYQSLPAATKELSILFSGDRRHCTEEAFVGALCATIDDATETISILPNLKSLCIYHCDFSTTGGQAAYLALTKHVDRRSQIGGFRFDLSLQLCNGVEEDERAKETRLFFELVLGQRQQ